jgi:S-adenosylmethionine uptake transporter
MTQNDSAKAMLMMIVAMLFLPGIDTIAKWLSGSIAAGQVTWSRFFFQILFMAPLLLRTSGPWFTSSLYLYALRGAFIAIATLFFFSGLKYLPIADAISIFFIEPLLVTLLSAVFLGEKVGWRRFCAISIGLLGALIIIRPSFAEVGWPVLLPVGAAVCFSFYILLTRKLVKTEDPIRLQFFAGIFGFIVMSIALIYGTESQVQVITAAWPSTFEWLLLGGLGLIATVAHAFRLASVGTLAPFQYVEIIGATFLGYVFFDDFPDTITWLGISIIISSGIYVFRRESLLAEEKKV